MRAIKDCEWTVRIRDLGYGFDWLAKSAQPTGLRKDYFSNELYDFQQAGVSNSRKGCVIHFKKFAKLNGITNFEII